MSSHRRRAASRVLFAVTLATACAEGATAPDATPPGEMPSSGSTNGTTAAVPYVVSGQVTDARGMPIVGAEVVADNQFIDNSYVIGRSDAAGRYELRLPTMAATWGVSASMIRTFNGTAYRVDLAPDAEGPIAGNRGAVRRFQWRVQGERPGVGGGYYGSAVVAYLAPNGDDLRAEDVELTLVPVGALIDGSAGQTIARRLTQTADGDAVVDVPIARYTIRARELRAGATPRPLELRLRNVGSYAATVTTDFATPHGTNLSIARITLEVRR
jgi:hypothetical protein